MSLSAFLRTVVGILDSAGVPYMLTGSLAAAFYAVPRATQDAGIVIETDPRQTGAVLRRLAHAEVVSRPKHL